MILYESDIFSFCYDIATKYQLKPVRIMQLSIIHIVHYGFNVATTAGAPSVNVTDSYMCMYNQVSKPFPLSLALVPLVLCRLTHPLLDFQCVCRPSPNPLYRSLSMATRNDLISVPICWNYLSQYKIWMLIPANPQYFTACIWKHRLATKLSCVTHFKIIKAASLASPPSSLLVL